MAAWEERSAGVMRTQRERTPLCLQDSGVWLIKVCYIMGTTRVQCVNVNGSSVRRAVTVNRSEEKSKAKKNESSTGTLEKKENFVNREPNALIILG